MAPPEGPEGIIRRGATASFEAPPIATEIRHTPP